MKKSVLFFLIICFVDIVYSQHFTPKQIVDYWEHDEEITLPKYKAIADYLRYGLPDSAKVDYNDILNLLGKHPTDKLLLYYKASKLQTESLEEYIVIKY